MVGSGLPNPQPGPWACADLSAAPLLPGPGSKGIGLLTELPAVSLLLPDLESGKGPSSSQEPHLFDVLRVPLRDELSGHFVLGVALRMVPGVGDCVVPQEIVFSLAGHVNRGGAEQTAGLRLLHAVPSPTPPLPVSDHGLQPGPGLRPSASGLGSYSQVTAQFLA